MNKKNIILILASFISICAAARDRLYIEDFQIHAGETYLMPLLLDNDTTYSTFQTDLYLPNGLEVALDEGEYIVDLTERKDYTHVVSTYRQADGAIRIFVTSQSVKPFSGNSGAIAIVEIHALSSFSGKKKVSLRGTVFVEENGKRHDFDNCIAYASDGSQSLIGDVNGDGRVNVSDVSALINMILGLEAMDQEHADVNGDGRVNVSDVTALINIILGI